MFCFPISNVLFIAAKFPICFDITLKPRRGRFLSLSHTKNYLTQLRNINLDKKSNVYQQQMHRTTSKETVPTAIQSEVVCECCESNRSSSVGFKFFFSANEKL